MNRIQQINQQGQSVWLDYIERNMVHRGELQSLVEEGVSGVTSNPTIFQKAISNGDAYEQDLQQLVATDKDAREIFESLAADDVQAATDVLRPVYEREGGKDGFVSIEVAPDLAYDTERTTEEARRLWQTVDRPNVMIKVPATEAGLEVIRALTSEGINVNVTLIFSRARYAAVKEAYIQGLEERLAAGNSIDHIASVASFFISRVDSKVDGYLDEAAANKPEQADEIKALKGKAAIANAKLAYQQFEEKFSGARWQKLADAGANVQRPLWASTSTKDPSYPDVLYVNSLIGAHTVNTMPPETYEATKDHATAEQTVTKNVDEAKQTLAAIEATGISMDQVTDELEEEGVQKFADSFTDLLDTIREQRKELVPASD